MEDAAEELSAEIECHPSATYVFITQSKNNGLSLIYETSWPSCAGRGLAIPLSVYWLGCRLDDRGIGVQFPKGNNSIFWNVQRWLYGALPPELKSPGHETHHSTLSRVEFRNTWCCCFTTPLRLHGEVLNLSIATALFHRKYREPLIIQEKHTELIAYFCVMSIIRYLTKLWRKIILYFQNVFC